MAKYKILGKVKNKKEFKKLKKKYNLIGGVGNGDVEKDLLPKGIYIIKAEPYKTPGGEFNWHWFNYEFLEELCDLSFDKEYLSFVLRHINKLI